MKDYTTANIRNIAVVGHGSDGKTTLVEALLYVTGAIDRQGRVEDGTATTDYDQEELKRHISISAAVAPLEFNETKINLIDVPGYFDFAGEMVGPLAVADGALITLSAVSGLDVGGEKAYALCEKNGLPRMFVVNQMDRENANFDKALASLTEKYGSAVAPIELPIVEKGQFTGVVCVLENKAYSGEGKNRKEIPIPESMKDAVSAAHDALMEAAASADEELMEKYFENMELSEEDTVAGIRKGTRLGLVVPVLCVSALTRIGTGKLLEDIVDLMPWPLDHEKEGKNPKTGDAETRVCNESAPFSAQVFKTLADPFVGKLSLVKVMSGVLTSDTALYNANLEKTEKAGSIYFMRGKKQLPAPKVVAGDICALAKLQATSTGHTLCDQSKPIVFPALNFPEPCIGMAVYAKKAGDEDKIFSGLNRLMEEDPTLRLVKNTETTETVLEGLGEMHIDVTAKKLLAKFGADCTLQFPKIPYRESIRKPIDVQGKHKKQSGGHGQYGDVHIRFSPGETEGLTFEVSVVGGTVPKNFNPAVEKGLLESMQKGVLAGYPVVYLKADLYDGSYHPVDSSEMAFKIAASLAYKEGLMKANPVLLEPVADVKVYAPSEMLGDIMSAFTKRRGRVLGMTPTERKGEQMLEAEAPIAEMSDFAIQLRAITQGRGTYTMKFERYEDVPPMVADKIIAEAKANAEE